jgi:hypothetical protein
MRAAPQDKVEEACRLLTQAVELAVRSRRVSPRRLPPAVGVGVEAAPGPGGQQRPLDQSERDGARDPEPEGVAGTVGGGLPGEARLPLQEPGDPWAEQIVQALP